jgi:hypothetical protein
VGRERRGNRLRAGLVAYFWHCRVNREREVVWMNLLSRLGRNKPLRVSEGSLRAIRRAQLEKVLSEEADKRRARKKAQAFKLNS